MDFIMCPLLEYLGLKKVVKKFVFSLSLFICGKYTRKLNFFLPFQCIIFS